MHFCYNAYYLMKEDLRVVKTKRAIEDAFISLIEEKGFESVKLVDIAKRANVNRNTIYLHYQSKEMIIESLVEKIFTQEVASFDVETYLKARYSRKKIYEMFLSIFEIINENIEIYRIILTDQNLSGYLTLKMRKIKSFLLDALKPTLKNEIIVEYVVSGVFGIFRNWIIYDKGSVDENAKMIADLTLSNMRHVQYR